MTHLEMTKHIRARIKAAGIMARVNKKTSCGECAISVFVPKYGDHFTDEEQREINHIAKVNGLTGAAGLEITADVPMGDSAWFVMQSKY